MLVKTPEMIAEFYTPVYNGQRDIEIGPELVG